MPSLRDIKKRIRTVKNTQKITRAMKLVAAAKLRRAQEAILAARPYAIEMGGLLHRVSCRAVDIDGNKPHPLLEQREVRRALLVVMTSDRGLCGGFNATILRHAERFITNESSKLSSLELATIGRKGADYFKKRRSTLRNYSGVFENLVYRRAHEIAVGLGEEFIGHNLDAVYLLYNEFKSAMSQKVVCETLLPIVPENLPLGEDLDYIYEPCQAEVLDLLVPRYLATEIWRALLESSASEHGARMTAMENATQNAGELEDSLTLQFNRARQGAITRELMDIVGGAEALRGK